MYNLQQQLTEKVKKWSIIVYFKIILSLYITYKFSLNSHFRIFNTMIKYNIYNIDILMLIKCLCFFFFFFFFINMWRPSVSLYKLILQFDHLIVK